MIIIICIIAYNKIEKFTISHNQTDTCYINQQYNMDVGMRKCQVYYSSNETECDANNKYYNMTDVQIDNEIRDAYSSNDMGSYNTLTRIRKYLKENDFKTCKLTYNDNWKEIEKYFDPDQNQSFNYTYPFKNGHNATVPINNKILSDCYSTSKNYSDIKLNDSIKPACSIPITNIHDIHTSNNEHISMTFNDVNYDNIYQSVCYNSKDTILTIPSYKYFFKIYCNYFLEENVLECYDIDIVTFNRSLNDFVTVQTIPTQILTKYSKRFTKVQYDKIENRIKQSCLDINALTYLINYHYCKTTKDFTNKNIVFNFKDFKVPDKVLDVDLSQEPDVIDVIDGVKILPKNIIDLNSVLNDLINNIKAQSANIKNDIATINNEIDALNKASIADEESIRKNDSNLEARSKIIIDSRNNTDTLLYTYIQNIKTLKQSIDNEFKRRSSLIYSSSSINDTNSIAFNTTLQAKNLEYLTMANTINNAINTEYNKTIEGIQNVYSYTIDIIKSNFKNGACFSLNLYNKGTLMEVFPKNPIEFTNILINTPIAVNYVDVLDGTNDNYYYTNIYNANPQDMKYFSLEISASIYLEEGYYYFYIDVAEEIATDVFIGYYDTNNSENIIFKNVAKYYKDGISTESNYTTKYPIFVSSEYNNGHYVFYSRSYRPINKLNTKYINIKCVKLSSAPETSYNILTQDNYDFIKRSSLSISSIATPINKLLYFNKNINPKPSRTSIYYIYTNISQKTINVPAIDDEDKSILYKWNFNNSLTSSVNNATFIKDASSQNTSLYNTNDDKYAIEISGNTNNNDYLKTNNITLPDNFTWTFWNKSSSCCNKIASLGEELYISVEKNKADNSDVYFIKGISQNSTSNYTSNITSTYYESVPTSSCSYVSYDNPNNISYDSYLGSYTYSTSSGNTRYVRNYNPGYSSCSTSYSSVLRTTTTPITITINTVVDTVPYIRDKWNMFSITYNKSSQRLRFYLNNELKYEKTGIAINNNTVSVKIFNQQSGNTTNSYSDMRIYNKELSAFDMSVLYYNLKLVKDPDPRIRKLYNNYYIYCSKMPKINTLPQKITKKLEYTPMIVPTLLNVSSTTTDYIPIYNQDKTNLDNFYKINLILDILKELRTYSTDDYNCIASDISYKLYNRVSQQNIDNKYSIIDNMNVKIINNDEKIINISNIITSIVNLNQTYDFATIKSIFKNKIVLQDKLFYKYIYGVFKNLKDNKHYMYIEI